MKTRFLTIALLLCGVSLFGVSAARADIMPVDSGDHIQVYDSGLPHYSNGGPFRVDNVTVGKQAQNVLTTFCMERDETLSYGREYRVELSTMAQRGGVNTDDGDALDPRTAYLFTSFHHRTNGGDLWSTSDLQEVIWYFEEELPITHTWSRQSAKDLYDLANGHTESLYDVRIMNLYDLQGNHAQSLLTVVPEPATVVMWGLLGVCGLMVVRRRQRRARSSAA